MQTNLITKSRFFDKMDLKEESKKHPSELAETKNLKRKKQLQKNNLRNQNKCQKNKKLKKAPKQVGKTKLKQANSCKYQETPEAEKKNGEKKGEGRNQRKAGPFLK